MNRTVGLLRGELLALRAADPEPPAVHVAPPLREPASERHEVASWPERAACAGKPTRW